MQVQKDYTMHTTYTKHTHTHTHTHTPLYADNGEVFTWGKAGPHLGYEVEGTKQLRPRLVHALSEQKITHVACGCAHTLGETCM